MRKIEPKRGRNKSKREETKERDEARDGLKKETREKEESDSKN